MKTLTVTIPDDQYECAAGLAAQRGRTLAEYVVDLLKQAYDQRIAEAQRRMADLFAALDKGRNRQPVGPLNRDELAADPCVLIRARDYGER
jgi:hypothetical protein